MIGFGWWVRSGRRVEGRMGEGRLVSWARTVVEGAGWRCRGPGGGVRRAGREALGEGVVVVVAVMVEDMMGTGKGDGCTTKDV